MELVDVQYLVHAAAIVSEEDMEANLSVIDRLEECDDVDSVEHNMRV